MFSLNRKRVRRLEPKLARGSEEPLLERLRQPGVLTAIGLTLLFWAGIVLIIGSTHAELFLTPTGAARATGMVLLIGLVTAMAAAYIAHFQPDILERRSRALRLVLLALTALALVRTCALVAKFPPMFFIVVTGATFAFVLALSYPRRTALALTGFLNLIIGLTLSDFILPEWNVPYEPVSLLGLVMILSAGSATAVFRLTQVRNRTRLIEMGFWSGLAYAATTFAVELYLRLTPPAEPFAAAAQEAGLALLAGVCVGIFVTALLPYMEKLFDITTSISLIELSDANHPLLRRMAMEAPGTFNHSLLIGTMCESAAEEIGGDGLLCRVGCYYHDIGKLLKPEYYIENQAGGDNKHDNLSPAMSKLIISNHPRDGVAMAEEAGLPPVLYQFIETHHGTTVMEYFFRLACSRRKEDEPEISDADFRYPGPKPRTRESAVVMLADGVEGAVRALSEPTPGRIEDVVHAISMKRLMDGQFGECDLTLADLHKIEQSFIRSLCSHYHGRIAYPSGSLDNTAKMDKLDSALRGGPEAPAGRRSNPEGSGRGVNAPIRSGPPAASAAPPAMTAPAGAAPAGRESKDA